MYSPTLNYQVTSSYFPFFDQPIFSLVDPSKFITFISPSMLPPDRETLSDLAQESTNLSTHVPQYFR